jgi:uncharacterized protein (DUF1778 family)
MWRVTLTLTVTATQMTALEAAASTSGLSVHDFVLRAALAAAQDVHADRVHYTLSPEDFGRFMEVLDRPAVVDPKLRALLSQSSVLED